MLKAAALQMVSSTRVEENLAAARALLEEAARQGCELAVLPENFAFMGRRDTDKLALGEVPGDGPIQRFLAEAARATGLWIVAGTLPMATGRPTHVRSACLAYAPDGRCVARYDKMHLFWFEGGGERHDESRTLERGEAPVAFELAARDGERWRIGLSICYDLRFPELYRGLRADVLLVPSAFTHVTGQAHWDALLRARAIENLAYVCAPAQGGTHENGRRTWGHSLLLDPWGQPLAERHEDGAGVVAAVFDRARLAQVRAQLPALEHRVL